VRTATHYHTLPHNAALPRTAKLPKHYGISRDFRGFYRPSGISQDFVVGLGDFAGSLGIFLRDFRGF
jgi:hypothetical protein